MPMTDQEQCIRILHLSDVHFRVGKGWDSEPVTLALARFIKTEVESGLAPDLVVFSGDLAFSGKPKEYKLAWDWLENQLWPALSEGLPRDRLLMVPGNHDVDRDRVDFIAKAAQSELLAKRDQSKIAEVLGNSAQRGFLLKRHAAYMDFVAGWYGESQPLPWWQRVIEVRGIRLHVAGLDTAWMSCGDEDRSRLLLGRYQLTQTVETPEAEDADWRIAVLHHPWEYLAEFDHHSSRSAVHQHRDLLLRGHLHQPLSERVLPPNRSRQCLELAAGCIYENSEYPNAFQWIELWSNERRVRVHFRLWQRNEWIVDRNLSESSEPYVDFDLGRRTQDGPVQEVRGAPKIPAEYLEWVWKRYADVALLGQDIKQSQAIKLSQVYVPALTQRAAAASQGDPEEAGTIRVEKPPPRLLERLNESSLFVSAAAGAGKSTFCRWAALQSHPTASTAHPVPASGYEEPVPTELQKRLPLLVPLREFYARMDCGRGEHIWCRAELEQALATWIDRAPPDRLSGALLLAHLKAGSAFLLLDGLDEVPVAEARDGTTVYPRDLLVSGLADALPGWEVAGNRTLLTSRPYGLDEAGLVRLGLAHAPIEPMPPPMQDLFVTRWFHTLGKDSVGRHLLEALEDREDLYAVAENPMLLTAVCVLYDNGGRLPEDRYELYKSIVDGVLHNRYPGEAREREPVQRRLEAIAYGMHTGEPGGAPRKTPAAEISWVETERLLADFAEQNPSLGRGEVDAAIQRDELLTRSGLLVPRPNERAAFYHLSFQEFLAAQRLARRGDTEVEQVIRERGTVPEWRPTLLFLFAALVFNKDPEWGLDLLARLLTSQDRAAVNANPATSVFVAEALELCLAKRYRIPDGLAESFRQLALHAIEDEIELQDRQALGLCLGRLGDPRLFDLRDRRAYVEVSAGIYPYGEKGGTVEIAAPFRLGRYPVTNSQYRAFLEDGGYNERKWWSDTGWAWRQKEGVTEPRYWQNRRFNAPNQPGGRRQLLRGRGLLRLGGRAPAHRSRSGRPPPAAREAMNIPGATPGRTASATPTRPDSA
jgi:3',5'-cyclic AMP phosphodiesterase CpdA